MKVVLNKAHKITTHRKNVTFVENSKASFCSIVYIARLKLQLDELISLYNHKLRAQVFMILHLRYLNSNYAYKYIENNLDLEKVQTCKPKD